MKGGLGHDSDSPHRDRGAVARIERAGASWLNWSRQPTRTGLEFRYPAERSILVLAIRTLLLARP